MVVRTLGWRQTPRAVESKISVERLLGLAIWLFILTREPEKKNNLDSFVILDSFIHWTPSSLFKIQPTTWKLLGSGSTVEALRKHLLAPAGLKVWLHYAYKVHNLFKQSNCVWSCDHHDHSLRNPRPGHRDLRPGIHALRRPVTPDRRPVIGARRAPLCVTHGSHSGAAVGHRAFRATRTSAVRAPLSPPEIGRDKNSPRTRSLCVPLPARACLISASIF